MCEVQSLIGTKASKAQAKWESFGFSGTVLLSPGFPPQYTIQSQSLEPGTTVGCSSGITVTD